MALLTQPATRESSVKKLIFVSLLSLLLAACAPEVGSEAWCKHLSDKPKGEWTADEAASYAKHCVM